MAHSRCKVLSHTHLALLLNLLLLYDLRLDFLGRFAHEDSNYGTRVVSVTLDFYPNKLVL